MISKEILTIVNPSLLYYYKTIFVFFGYNSKLTKISNIDSCREGFARGFTKKHNYIGFKLGENPGSLKKIAKFFNYREEKLNIPQKDRSVFYITNIDNTFICKFNKIWIPTDTSRQLFTLLLRASANQKSNSLSTIIDNDELAREVKPAILRFLNGYTKPTFKRFKKFSYDEASWHHDNGGFVYHFQNISPDEVKKMLVKP